MATLIGTPPNAILAGVVERLYDQRISFAAWMAFGLPLSLVMLGLAWVYLTRIAYSVGHETAAGVTELISKQLAELGPMSWQERAVAIIFAAVAISWIGRGLLHLPALEGVTDASIAMAGAMLLFIIPADLKKREFLLDWPTAVKLPWDILLLFGGGFALAGGFSDSGLTKWIVEQLSVLQGAPLVVLILVVIFLTEVTSNTATATLFIPVLGALATAVDVQPLNLMVPAAVAASYAFMLPVATPPNAIVFSSRYITIPQMARTGLWLNLLASLIITAFVILLLPVIQ